MTINEPNINVYTTYMGEDQETFCFTWYYNLTNNRTQIIIFIVCVYKTGWTLESPSETYICLMVFNATFNNISVISWRSVLLVEETGGLGENHRGSKGTTCFKWPLQSAPDYDFVGLRVPNDNYQKQKFPFSWTSTTCLGLWCLMPLSTIFQLYGDSQFYWRRKPPTCCKSLTNFIT